MNISSPSIPIHLARAYGVQTKTVVQPVSPVSRQGATRLDTAFRAPDAVKISGDVQAIRPTEAGRDQRIESVVAAKVPGGIRFTENGPEPSASPEDLRTAEGIRSVLESKLTSVRPSTESAAIPMYRNPAMKNAAAASIAHSRSSIDISG